MLPFRTILFPTDFSPPADAALAAAVELSRHFRAMLHVVHVVPALRPVPIDHDFTFRVPEYAAALDEDARQKLEAVRTRLTAAAIASDVTVGHGDAGREIVRIAAEVAADVIVIATHGETGWRHVLFGSVAERVVQHAPCPVLTIRAPRT